MDRVINFNAGPSGIPLDVLKKAQEEFLSYHGLGYSIIEASHRTPIFENILFNARDKIKKLYGFSDDYDVLFLQGGASLQFVQIPMNLSTGKKAEYINTGVWTTKAIKEAQIQGINYEVIASSEDTNFDRIPTSYKTDDEADYLYICSNNTIYGTQYKEFPKTKAPLVVDSSSDLFSRKVSLDNIGIFYGGIQKNGGPAGVTMVVIRKDLAERVSDKVPNILRYKTQMKADSMSNTPNTFGIYMLDLMLDWIIEKGGLDKIASLNGEKAKLLYGCIDELDGFYKGHAQRNSRSIMNVSYNIVANKELEPKFVKEAMENGMIGLKGHRHLGGIRASIYNSVSYENVEVLVDFMREFARKNG
ncbi:phosphohydroxythreonine aminotransferase / 3-phosphoserine aminotransferase [Campylobacter blaseri]|uniref:Phosphoserine aminotransferase n=1 Tax=Campylobacter blaseri TaxID=2042961 RepID=A0A2P8R167_9BACT|nr:3-phosphoserine/phosphohydroxythreonine transaminase [Campylobacter blaseri]PSM52239.1 3-phosphoserine/phosphohydroxythreonine aminotransferase [Campylobacter blaseri]PSM54005.1 3-phosphoserine/phosphohydroxythreonine aminotransferase [Campylobacter blaseri]QKF85443.1 phosphohydroxythreonine aminotransferase / 3-phosphoserine aminotransferase [Campylobacter blaseri]